MNQFSEKPSEEDQLIRDCRVLFGPGLHITPEFLTYLQFSGAKSAFRQRALETHPDMHFPRTSSKRTEQGIDFIAVRQAFENLSNFIKLRETVQSVETPLGTTRPSFRTSNKKSGRRAGPASGPGEYKSGTSGSSDGFRTSNSSQGDSSAYDTGRLYRGEVPDRKLLLGHFLYYKGLVSWQSIVQALIWQRSSRPRLGELAKRLGWLTDDHVRLVLDTRDPRQPFGRSAVEKTLLSERQCDHLLAQQRNLQKKIGRFFVESGRLTPEQFSETIFFFHLHNIRVQGRRCR